MTTTVKYQAATYPPSFTLAKVKEMIQRDSDDYDPEDDYDNFVIRIQFPWKGEEYAFTCGAYYTPESVDNDGSVDWEEDPDWDRGDNLAECKAIGGWGVPNCEIEVADDENPEDIALEIVRHIGIPDAVITENERHELDTTLEIKVEKNTKKEIRDALDQLEIDAPYISVIEWNFDEEEGEIVEEDGEEIDYGILSLSVVWWGEEDASSQDVVDDIENALMNYVSVR